MKKSILKIMSLILTAVLLVGLLQATCVLADNAEQEELHKLVPTVMSYSGHSHTTISGSQKGFFRTLWNNYCAVYAITLETDTDFDMSLLDTATGRTGVAYKPGFAGYGPHLDYAFTGYASSDDHNAVAQKLGESISVNGVTIAEAFKENVYTSMSVLVGILDNKLTLIIPVGMTGNCTTQVDNTATKGLYVGDFCESAPASKEFIIEIKEGLDIGGVKFAGTKYHYTPVNTDWNNNGTFTEVVEEPGTEGLHELSPTAMAYSGHSHSTISGTQKGQFRTLWNNYCAVYAITLESDTSFDMSLLDTATGRTGVAYRPGFAGYGSNLDYAFTGYASSDEHNAVAQKIGNGIAINGVTIAEAFEENTYTSMSVLVGISDNKVTLVIPVGMTGNCATQIDNNAKNGLYVGDLGDAAPASKEFILEIKEGLEIGGIEFAGAKYRYTPINKDWNNTGKFTELLKDYQDTAKITGVETVANTDSKFSSGVNGGYTVVTIDTDRKMSESAAVNDATGLYYTTRLNQKNVKYTFEKTSSYKDFQKKILINGIPLSAYMLNHAKAQEEFGAPANPDWDIYLGVGASVVKNDTHKLYLSLPVEAFTSGTITVSGEKYGYDLSDGFTVTILPGLMLNGSNLQTGVITVTPDESEYKSTFAALEGLYGDVNGDSEVDMFDLIRLKKILSDSQTAGDVKVFGNDSLFADDLVYLRNYLLNN